MNIEAAESPQPRRTEPEPPNAPVRLSRRSRLVRVLVTLAILGGIVYGTFWGQDDLFPFGPFKMYATADKLNSPVADTRWELVDTTGATIELTQYNTGIRRAEIEGQIGRFEKDPALLSVVDDAYVKLNPRAPKAVLLRIVVRWHYLKDGVATGKYSDQVVASWAPPGAGR